LKQQFVDILYVLFQTYYWLLVLRVFLTWIPSINWGNQPFSILAKMCDWLLNPFKKFVPAFGGIDFSPMAALIVYGVLYSLIIRLLDTLL
jgi:YggT family protein